MRCKSDNQGILVISWKTEYWHLNEKVCIVYLHWCTVNTDTDRKQIVLQKHQVGKISYIGMKQGKITTYRKVKDLYGLNT